MADKFKKGELVQLKSGGPPMTVNRVPSDTDHRGEPIGYYHCVWFKGASKETDILTEHLLEEYEPPKK